MKALKWFWLIALITIGFKLYNLALAGPGGYASDQMQAFVGMVMVFALITCIIIMAWVVRLAKTACSEKLAR
ncbi:hypothetical protein FDK21_14230 [Cohaesibacter sp. CAU 1516]|uniref:hypothetical protein n=1 Tax=Cohaesibacter sp. CAU 1516 TaxID=2576038 RepID=UPI0010FCE98A|nr:hypothetical protein [Cohaesibacter sp. CAU 1516]TLP44917.1 hypothetical protein FDK21_14230 [Cohaesibacter sp. CAU 1516]